MREADLQFPAESFAALGIEELVALTRAAGLIELEELSCRGSGGVIQTDVERRYDESALSGLSYVESWNHVADTAEGHVYVISFVAPELPATMAETAESLIGTCDPEVDAESTTVSLVGPQEAIAETVSEYERAGVSPELRKLGGYDGSDGPLNELTDRQREVIETAWELGYYEVPRTVSVGDIAAELGVDGSTVAEHLQRAERNLLGTLL
jgi:hypothetical protein